MIIFNADDFGLCSSVNQGIIEAYKNGVVKSTTIMANGLAFEEAVKLSNENPGLGIGIHLVLSTLKPLTKNHSLTASDGNFHSQTYLLENPVDLVELELEYRAQIKKVVDSGIKLTHIDGHHHLYAIIDGSNEIVEKLAKEYGLVIRNFHNVEKSELYPYTFSDEFYKMETVEELIKIIEEHQDEDIEIMCHPSHVNEDLTSLTTYAKNRQIELEILSSDELKSFLEDKNIKIVNYNGGTV